MRKTFEGVDLDLFDISVCAASSSESTCWLFVDI